MIKGVGKVYCDREVVARVKCGSGGRMAIFGSWNGRRSRPRSVAKWAAEGLWAGFRRRPFGVRLPRAWCGLQVL
jgi:hypothetical protein